MADAPTGGVADALVFGEHVQRRSDAAQAGGELRAELILHMRQRDLGIVIAALGVLTGHLQYAGELLGEVGIDLAGDARVRTGRGGVTGACAFFGLDVGREVGLIFGRMHHAQRAEAAEGKHRVLLRIGAARRNQGNGATEKLDGQFH